MPGQSHLPIVVTHQGGVRFDAQVRSHHVLVDQPFSAGGTDSAPTPLELIGAALGTCIAFYVQQFLSARSLPYEGMRVEVAQQKASHPSRLGAFSVRVLLPTEVPGGYAELIERVARSCPAHGTLTNAAQVIVQVELPAAAAA